MVSVLSWCDLMSGRTDANPVAMHKDLTVIKTNFARWHALPDQTARPVRHFAQAHGKQRAQRLVQRLATGVGGRVLPAATVPAHATTGVRQ